MYYYGLSIGLTEPYQTVSAMINGANQIRIEILDETPAVEPLDPLLDNGYPDVTEVNLTKEEAVSLMYHLQYLISLLPVIKG